MMKRKRKSLSQAPKLILDLLVSLNRLLNSIPQQKRFHQPFRQLASVKPIAKGPLQVRCQTSRPCKINMIIWISSDLFFRNIFYLKEFG